MIIYDTTKKHMLLSGSGIDIITDLHVLICRAFYQMSCKNIDETKQLIKMFGKMTIDLADNNELFRILEVEAADSTTINLSHLMNKRGEGEDEQR